MNGYRRKKDSNFKTERSDSILWQTGPPTETPVARGLASGGSSTLRSEIYLYILFYIYIYIYPKSEKNEEEAHAHTLEGKVCGCLITRTLGGTWDPVMVSISSASSQLVYVCVSSMNAHHIPVKLNEIKKTEAP